MAVGPGVDVAFSSPTPIGHMNRVWWAGVAYSPKAPEWLVGVCTPRRDGVEGAKNELQDRLVFCFERGLGAFHLAAIVISVGLAVVAFVASAVVALLGARVVEYALGECAAKRCDLRLVTAGAWFSIPI